MGRALRHVFRRALRPALWAAVWVAPAALTTSTPAGPQPGAIGESGVGDLPIVEVAAESDGDVLAVLLTGDGGWAPIDREVAAVLAEHGVAVVGLDSRAYLSTPRTPERVAADVSRIARRYMALWHRARLAIVGYSRGADTAPFVATRLPPDLRGRLALVAMLAPGTTASFSFHWMDLVRDRRGPDDRPVVPEVERLRGTAMLCVHGAREPGSACPSLPPGLARTVTMPGGHHLGGDYGALGRLILHVLWEGRGPSPASGSLPDAS